MTIGDRFVGDAGNSAIKQLFGQLSVRSKVQVSKKQLPFAHARILVSDRLFYFYDHFTRCPDIIGSFKNSGAGAFVEIVVKAGALTRGALYHNFMIGISQGAAPAGSLAYATFVGFDLLG